MSEVGRTLFAGSPFMRWTIGPVAMATAVGLPLCIPEWTPVRAAIVAGFDLALVMLTLTLFAPHRARWAGRLLCALVVAGYGAYFVGELVTDPAGLVRPAARSESTAFNALLGLIVIGSPCLVYAIFGRFTIRAEAEPGPGPDDGEEPPP